MKFDLMTGNLSWQDSASLAAKLDDAGFSGMLFTETSQVPWMMIAAAAQSAPSLEFSTGIAVAFPRSPMVSAQVAWELAGNTGGRFRLGLGSQVKAHITRRYGADFDRPAARMRDYVLAVKACLAAFRGESRLDHDGPFYALNLLRREWIPPAHDHGDVKVDMAAVGPLMCRVAGEVADGVICGLGLEPEIVARCLEHLQRGAQRAGRRLEDLDIWAMARVNVGSDRAALIREIRMELASTAHHAFRFTLAGKQVPPAFHQAIRRVQTGYQPHQHEAHGESPNARLIADPEFLEYMAQRFAILGTPEECADQIRRVGESGISNILFTGFVEERQALLRTLGDSVFPLV